MERVNPNNYYLIALVAIMLASIVLQARNIVGVYIMEYSQKGRRLRLLLEVLVLGMCHIEMLMLFELGWYQFYEISLDEMLDIRWIAYGYFGIYVVVMVICFFLMQRWQILILLCTSIILLPEMRIWLKDYYFIFLILFNLYLAIRAYQLATVYNGRHRKRLSGASIKESLDILPSGVLVFNDEKQVVFMNDQMQELIHDLMGRLPNDADQIYWHLMRLAVRTKDEEMKIDGKVIYNRKKGTYWMINRSVPKMNGRIFVVLVISNITREWNLNLELHKQTKSLKKQSEELKKALEDMEEESQRRQIIELKGVFHDVIGQKIALLLRSLREKKKPEKEILGDFTNGVPLLQELLNDRVNPWQHMEILVKTFEAIGIEMFVEGDFPEDIHQAETFVSILREAATNAVRHGYAHKIYVKFEDTETQRSMRVTNDGTIPPYTMVEGNGIKGMRKRLIYEGGYLLINRIPEFVIVAIIPKIK